MRRWPEQDEGQWHSIHVFYGMDAYTLLRDCLFPLVGPLVRSGEVLDFFYINYWLEGFHVRFRLLLQDPADQGGVVARVVDGIRQYISANPSLHPEAGLDQVDVYHKLFVREYPEEDFTAYLDEYGMPRLQMDNTAVIRPYEREYGRYGGKSGIIMSEYHFCRSTDLVRTLIAMGNLQTRSIRLGLGAEVIAVTTAAFFGSASKARDFLKYYHQQWVDSFDLRPGYTSGAGRQSVQANVDKLRVLVVPMMQRLLDGGLVTLPGFLQPWIGHCLELRSHVESQVSKKALIFGDPPDQWTPDSGPDAMWALARSYVHMTDNRALINIREEAYLAYLLGEALGEGFDESFV